MRILWVVTKPPWPPIDGGRVVIATTLAALRARGHDIDLVAPYDPDGAAPDEVVRSLTHLCRAHLIPVRQRPALASALATLRTRAPLAIARHDVAAVRAAVTTLLDEQAFDVVHTEQLQALAQCAGARTRGVPVVLRCQNVESDLWRGWARRGTSLGALARIEAARLAAFEGRALRGVSAVTALTADDAARLTALAGGDVRVAHIAAPYPAELPAGPALGGGRPRVAVLGSAGWQPNRDGIDWLAREAWPRIRAQLPDARLHVFGGDHEGTSRDAVIAHAAPADSAVAFPADAICVVPLRYGSGVRMRILEAWARGVPVVATPQAVHGLDVESGRELLVAWTADELAAALRTLDEDASLRAAVIDAGRARLRAAHDPDLVAARLEQLYRRAADRAPH